MIFLLLWLFLSSTNDWGFFGHTLLNRLAVYTLPEEILPWYKPNINYLAEHATDADKRRYASKFEAVRHYIDLDHWGNENFDHLPMTWDSMLANNLVVYHPGKTDTQFLLRPLKIEEWNTSVDFSLRLSLVREFYLRVYFEDSKILPDTVVSKYFIKETNSRQWHITDHATEHGVVLYHLSAVLKQLTNAFGDRDLKKVLRLSADLGHYVGDACVPLHTTKNYNGQLTGQHGIHAFWETRIPELLADKEFDFLVGTASYISEPAIYFRNIVIKSHSYVDDVLRIEREIRDSVPKHKQQCLEIRNQQSVFLPCDEYTRLYNSRMNNMVEERFRVAIKAIGDCWYTAWINAGQPQFKTEMVNVEEEATIANDPAVQPLRAHE